ncbi:MAG: hypothetical protein KGI27_13935, partial [Thaumarchaeota archaeon]|nr:hypothetical protein [Nitrososphaerota archaeon]
MKTGYLAIIIGLGVALIAIGNSNLLFAQEGGFDLTGAKTYSIIDSPLKQFKSGIKAEDVKCASDLILAVNRHYSPACIKETSAIELLLRGWAIGFAHHEAVFFMKPNSTSQIAVNYFPNHYEGSSPPDMIMNLYSRVYKPNSSFPTNEINATAKPYFIHTSSDTMVNY